ncbi:N-acetylmuramoyl-L-alanine amidase [hydrothermal vent metagenome]|uniref:N-acetylmuramoyl-L-alanine amidase n=1 Tax=hydrothermal vent metagenome TaxID=652676 RepID=A0A3B0TH35_9ZZZZ
MKLEGSDMIRIFLIVVLLILGQAGIGASAGFAQSGALDPAISNLPKVMAVRVSNSDGRSRLIIDMEKVTPFAFVSLVDPLRIALDVRSNGFPADLAGKPAGEGFVSKFELTSIAGDRVRTVLSLGAPAQVQQAYWLEAIDNQPARLVVDLIGDSAENFAAKAELDRFASEQSQKTGAALENKPNAPGTSQVKSQSRPLILIDPGHGGIDGGAKTPDGIEEKTLTLAFAKQLQQVLISSGRFDVALSRDDDRFIQLGERVQLARANNADLFISIHADTFEDATIRGASIYTRDEQATDILDKVLADQENKADLLAGFVKQDASEAVVGLLVDLMRREMRRQSYLAAKAILQQLRPTIRVRRFPLRRAGFFVLQSPDVPSILLELGFLSNRADENNLISPSWRLRMSEAVARGIVAYFDQSSR